MDVFLTEKELEREENLFSAREESYSPLKRREYEIKDYVPEAGDDIDRPKPPPSC